MESKSDEARIFTKFTGLPGAVNLATSEVLDVTFSDIGKIARACVYAGFDFGNVIELS
jgi:hypothetical protein